MPADAAALDAALTFCAAFKAELGDVDPAEARDAWAGVRCAELPPAFAFLALLAALAQGPELARAQLARAVARIGGRGAAAGEELLALCETRPEALALEYARTMAVAVCAGGPARRLAPEVAAGALAPFFAAHACAQLAIYHGGGRLELASAVESLAAVR